tara:strand:+ start:6510 stop:6674 length:165 start_codon:yes stop_codon:yes gene_type:complete
MKIRINELSKALNVDTADVIAVCTLLELPANTRISSLSIEDAKKVTDYFKKNGV